MSNRPLGSQTIRVLGALAGGCRYGFDIVHRTGMISATVYRALRRLEKLEMVRSRWEDPDTAETENRPRRRYYSVTRRGRAALAQVQRQYADAFEASLAPLPGSRTEETS